MAFRTNKTPVLQEKTASGSVASFNTILQKPLVNGEFTIQAYQEGTGDPSPDNVRPIHGFDKVNATRLGKNVWGEGVGNPDVSYLYNGWRLRYSTNARIVFFDKDTSQDISGIYFGYTMTGKDGTGGGVRWAIANGTVRPNDVATSIHHYISVYPPNDSTLEKLFNRFYVMVVIDNATYDTYEPYVTPTIYTIQLGQEVYGAEVDVVNGVAHVTYITERIDHVDSVALSYIKSDACDGFKYLTNVPSINPSSGEYNYLCNCFSRLVGIGIWSSVGYSNMFQINSTQVHLNIANDLLGITDYTQETPATSKAKINEWLSNNIVMLNRPLLTPFDIQLTPQQIETLIGNNTIFADTGDVDLTFNDLDIAKRGSFREVFKLPS